MPSQAHSPCLPLPGPWSHGIQEAAALYRPRRPERTNFYALLEQHLEDYIRVHSERFEPRHGVLRRVVQRVGEAFLDCGRFHGGFARLRCDTCEAEHLIAFSCQTRNFCPSCQAKRAALFGEFLAQRVLLPVPHRHVVFTVPKALRGLFERDRRLLGILARSAYDATRSIFQRDLDLRKALPGMVSSIQTFGSFANFHPHVHALLTKGLLERGGAFHPLAGVDTEAIEQRFRRLVLDRLVRAERLSEDFRDRLLSWEHSGFSVHAGEAMESTERESLERMARYMSRAPVALGKVFRQEDGRVKLLTPRDPKTGRDYRVFDPLDWVHAVTTQIPDARQHLIGYQGAYANTARARYRPEVGDRAETKDAQAVGAEERAEVAIHPGDTEDEASSFDTPRPLARASTSRATRSPAPVAPRARTR